MTWWMWWLTGFCIMMAIGVAGWLLRLLDERRRQEASSSVVVPAPAAPPGDSAEAPPRCRVCNALADVGMPVIVNSGLDQDKLGVRKLHVQTPGYDVLVDESKGAQLCVPHARSMLRRKQEDLARLRSKLATVNSEVEQEVTMIESGMALAHERKEWRRVVSELGAIVFDEPGPPLLPQVAGGSSHTVTILPDEEQ